AAAKVKPPESVRVYIAEDLLTREQPYAWRAWNWLTGGGPRPEDPTLPLAARVTIEDELERRARAAGVTLIEGGKRLYGAEQEAAKPADIDARRPIVPAGVERQRPDKGGIYLNSDKIEIPAPFDSETHMEIHVVLGAEG